MFPPGNIRILASRSILRRSSLAAVVLPRRSSTLSPRVLALAEALKSSRDLVGVHDNGAALAAEIQHVKVEQTSPGSSDDTQRVHSVLQLLAASGRPEDMDRLAQILQFQRILGVEPSPKIYQLLIRVFLDNQHDMQLVDFLRRLSQLPGKYSPSLAQLHAILDKMAVFSDVPTMLAVVSAVVDLGVKSNQQTFSAVFDAFWNTPWRDGHPPKVEQLFPVVEEMARLGVPYDSAVADALFLKFTEAGLNDAAAQVIARYEQALETAASAPSTSSITDSEPSASLQESTDAEDIYRVEQQTLVDCSPDDWALVIANTLKSRNPQKAFDLYDEALGAGVIPNSTITVPLLYQLSREGGSNISDSAVDLSMQLYQRIISAHPTPTAGACPTASVYRILARILTQSTNIQKSLPLLQSLISDMEARGLSTNVGWLTAARIILQMRKEGSFAGAKEFYKDLRSTLDESGFNAILREYCRLAFRGKMLANFVTEYFSIINDMRLQRVRITPQVYTTVLFYIGNTATRIRRDDPESPQTEKLMAQLVQTTRRTHDFLTLDASVSPDAALWNQLMNTYQRLQCFGDAFRVWEMMYLTRRYDQISVNIILDACGYAGQLQVAKSVMTKLGKAGFRIDMHNWNTWIECLCRMRRLDLATAVVCVDMEKRGMQPDVESFRILYKFSQKEHQWDRVRTHLETYQPQLWQQYSREIETS